MIRSPADDWPLARSLAFLAATFAIVLGTLLPFGAMAGARPGEPVVMCSIEGPLTVQVGGDMDGPGGKTRPAKCAACVLPLLGALPTPPRPQGSRSVAPEPAEVLLAAFAASPPPARAPPRPPSTAPPLS